MEIVLPDPSLVILVGAAGSGKSTFAAKHFAPDEVLSSDGYRALVSGDETDQGATRAAFGRLHRDLERRLGAEILTVVDATNVEPAARGTLLARSRAAAVPATAIVFDLPAAVVIARNAARRPRTVDEQVVHRHLGRLRTALDGRDPPIEHDGFVRIIVLRDADEVDLVTIRRAPKVSRPNPP